MGYQWEQEEFDGNNGNLMGIQPPTPTKNKKHPLGACCSQPIGSPRMLHPKVLFRDNLLGQVLLMYEVFLTNCVGQGQKIRWSS